MPCSLTICNCCRQLIGVDICAAAIKDAKANAKRNQLHNATFHCLDLAKPEDVQRLCEAAPHVDVAIAGGRPASNLLRALGLHSS